MPKVLSSDIDIAREENHSRDVCESRKNATRGMHNVSLDGAEVVIGDSTNNGTRKSHKPSDRVANHSPNRAYVLSDLTVIDGHSGKTVAIRRTTSRIVQRNNDGTVDAAKTLAVASHVNRKRGTIDTKVGR